MKKRSRETAMPDITPLIDVVFLLLIFFMVSTVFKKDELALLLNLPTVTDGESQSQTQKTIIIELSTKEVAFNGKKLSFEEMGAELAKVTKKKTPIDVRVDKDVKYERVVKVLDELKKYKLNNLSLITNK
ncbi:MAG: biopolymer transporter ExbD [Bdellovibrionota bacterium]|jgi:biopolymer transport protein ExbD|nr:biopolymer transporter ExbD [Bdellovibrionota bacterium]